MDVCACVSAFMDVCAVQVAVRPTKPSLVAKMSECLRMLCKANGSVQVSTLCAHGPSCVLHLCPY